MLSIANYCPPRNHYHDDRSNNHDNGNYHDDRSNNHDNGNSNDNGGNGSKDCFPLLPLLAIVTSKGCLWATVFYSYFNIFFLAFCAAGKSSFVLICTVAFVVTTVTIKTN